MRNIVEIRYNLEVTPELIAAEALDVLIVATGSLSAIPPIPGLNNGMAVTADDLLADRRTVTDRVLVIRAVW